MPYYRNEQQVMWDMAAELAAKDAEITRLRAALTPILSHAEAHDYAPPLKFSVAACREIKEKVDGTA